MRHTRFAQFYHLRDGSYVEGVGDRQVLILVGWEAEWQHALQCEDWARKHGFDGFRICRGWLNDPFYLTAAVIPVVRT